MAPNPRVARAFSALKDLGIPEAKVKPILKNTLKLYDKNWEPIEAENYRVLVDAYFDAEESQAAEPKKKHQNADVAEPKKKKKDDQEVSEEAEGHGELERPLKRLRLKYQENHVSTSAGHSSPKLNVNSRHLQLQTVEKPSLALIKPKDEPVSDDLLPFEVPIAVMHPEQPCEEQLLSGNGLTREAEVPESPTLQFLNGKESDDAPISSDKRETQSGLANTIDESSTLAIASTAIGEMKISLSFSSAPGNSNFRMPNFEEVIKMMEKKCLGTYKLLDLKKVFDEVCHCALELGASSITEAPGTSDVTPFAHSVNGSMPPDGMGTTENSPTPLSTEEAPETIDVTPFADSMNQSERPNALGTVETSPTTKRLAGDTQHASKVGQNSSINGMVQNSAIVSNLTEKSCVDKASCPENACSHSIVIVEQPNSRMEQNGPDNANSHSFVLVEVEQAEVLPLATRSHHDVNDISNGQESVGISLVNEVNDEPPPSFRYIKSNVICQDAYINFSLAGLGERRCLTCLGDCLSSLKPCACSDETRGVFAYTIEGVVMEDFLEECIDTVRGSRKQSSFFCKDCPLERLKDEESKEGCKGHLARKYIKECWLKCGCGRQCGNRVVQRGINCNLQVFMTNTGKGWGLRTLEDLQKGSFVCEYIGEILTTKELHERISQVSSTEKHEYPVLLDADWSRRILKDEEALCLDATYYGNVARFINHRCFDANLIGIPVEVDTPEHHYYHFAFFTTRKVEALEELTRDYGVDFDDHDSQFKGFQCHCNSKFCRNLRRFTRSRSSKRRI